MSETTWAQVHAMERSHAWQNLRVIGTSRTCSVCKDTEGSPVRYCPGTAAAEVTDET